MAETFGHKGLDAGVTKPQPTGHSGTRRVGLRARAAAPSPLRTGPSKAAAGAVIARALSAVDVRMVGLLSQPLARADKGVGLSPLEIALLSRLDRTLRAHSQALADDVVLCDSAAEFAENVHATLLDLDASAAIRLPRFVNFLREVLAELMAHKSDHSGAIKQQLRTVRAQLVQVASRPEGLAGSSDELQSVSDSLQRLHQDLSVELERVCPRQGRAYLDALVDGLDVSI